MRRGHRPEMGPDRPRAPDEAGDPLESKMGQNHRSVNVGRGHMPETGPDRPKAPDEAGVSLEA